MSRIALALLVVLAVVTGTRPAASHPLDVGYLRLEKTPRGLAIVLEVESAAIAPLLGITAEAVGTLASSHPRDLAAATYRLAEVTTDAGACVWKNESARLLPGTATLAQSATLECSGELSTLRWDLPFVAKLEPTFELLVKAYVFSARVATLRPSSHVLELSKAHEPQGFVDLVLSGIHHIGAAPSEWHDASGFKLAEGLDHVLFVLLLLLRGGTVRRLLGIVTGFTLGHSVSLGLAAFGVLRISPSVIEPLVALTIAATAVDVFFGRFEEHRWKISTLFGLVHGFAFANALAGLQLGAGHAVVALLGFNLGVEAGQLLIVALVAPLVVALHRYRPRVGRWFVRVVSATVFVLAIYWFIDRL